VLRTLAWSIAIWQVFRHACFAIMVLFAARELGFSAGRIGALWMLAGAGSLCAAAAVARLNLRLGFGPTLLAGMFGTGVAWLLLAATPGGDFTAVAIFGLGLFVLDFCGMAFFVNYLTLRQAATPDALLGRVVATMICLTVAMAPLGGLAGGWIAEHFGLRATLVISGLGAIVLVTLVAWTSPLMRLRALGETPPPRRTESVAEELAG
jgi:predicted MFS family arabinose efflux permease